MWNRPLLFLWFSINSRGDNHHFKLSFPLPLFVLPMFLDMVDDLMDFANLISVGNLYRKNNSLYSGYMAKQWLSLVQNMVHELIWNGEPDDIVDIDVAEGCGKERFQMKLLLR